MLTVGDTEGFLETGGMIRFVQDKDRIRWEINQTPLRQAGMRLNSQILKHAKRVINIPDSP